MRINQFVSDSGKCSRREADRLIESGRVVINGVRAKLGDQVNAGDAVLLDGKPVVREEEKVCILVNKPAGITSTTDPKDKSNIVRFVNYHKRLFMIGRLDKDSEGAILLTNDGNYVNALLRSENEHEKEYFVRVDKDITDGFLDSMSKGVRIYNPVSDSEVVTKPCKIIKKSGNTFMITLTQGYNRQIRRMAQALGYTVTYLKRERFLFLTLKGLKTGQWRMLSSEEMERIEAICNSSQRID